MNQNLSKNMVRCIEEVQKQSLKISEPLYNFEAVEIRKKITKKKVFLFRIIKMMDKPFIQLYINERFYTSYLLNKGKWVEEKDFSL